MSAAEKAPVKAMDLGRAFFQEVVRPAMEKVCPQLLDRAACGRFGLGSECLGLDDAISQDHHWGPRVDIMLPEKVFQQDAQELMAKVASEFPKDFRGYKLESGHVGGAGLSPEGMDSFLMRSVGRTTAPQTNQDWLDIPEEDIIHVINGEVWHDGLGDFTRLREAYLAYYPDEVWKRRIAHWCRYCSGMGLYGMHRAVLRKNYPYAFTALGRTMKLTMELTFLLNRTYFTYDKWLYPLFKKLPHLAPDLDPLLSEVTQSDTPWSRRISLFEDMHDILDTDMVAQGLIDPHPKFKKSPTQGYRLLESAYGDLCRTLPREILEHIPQWDQIYLEKFHSGFVANLGQDDWRHALGLDPE
jgi:hypothetical protein